MNQSTFFHTINQFTRHFSKALNEALVPHGLYSAQWSIIYYLFENGAATQKELSTYFGVEAPTMTRTIARLEKSGWIIRKAGSDKREKHISLTPKAIEQYPIWIEAVKEVEAVLLRNVKEDDRHSAFATIKTMLNNMN